MKTRSKTEGVAQIDPKQMSDTDLNEGAYMLQACATLLRQSFGIVSLTNCLLDNPMSESELKNFAQSFDIVHKTCGTFINGIAAFVKSRQSTKS